MLPYDTRPHRWQGLSTNRRCSLCGMLASWEGARYSCTGVDLDGPKSKAARKRNDAKRVRGPRQPDAAYAKSYRLRREARLRDVSDVAALLEQAREARR